MDALEPHSSEKKTAAWILALFRRLWFVPILLVAVVELALHIKQTHASITPEQWLQAREAITSQAKDEDLVLVAPSWLSPVARMHLGDGLMTLKRVARSDDSRFPRAFELALGSSRTASLRPWNLEEEMSFGSLTLRRLINPAFRPVITDLVDQITESKVNVTSTRGSKEEPCRWRKTVAVTGHLGHGPAAPAGRFHCPGHAWVAQTVLADLEYKARRCIYAPPPGKTDLLRIEFKQVRFGTRLEGHHALYVEAERDGKGPPVTVVFKSQGKTLGQAVHRDGEGWVAFAFETPALAGTAGQLVAEVSSSTRNRRMYCFEATTR